MCLLVCVQGIVDSYLQEHNPQHHTIVEAHPQVYRHLVEQGWTKKSGVRVLFGRWQDVKEKIKEQQYDGVFFDTFGEGDVEMDEFHTLLPHIVKPGGVYSYFNGMCPSNLFFHGVVAETMSLKLRRLGLTTTFVPMSINCSNEEIWRNLIMKYWHWDVYYLPISVMSGGDQDADKDWDRIAAIAMSSPQSAAQRVDASANSFSVETKSSSGDTPQITVGRSTEGWDWISLGPLSVSPSAAFASAHADFAPLPVTDD